MVELPDGVEAAVSAAGSIRSLADFLRIAPASIYHWKRVPAERVHQIARQYGLSPTALRPDLFPPPTDGLANDT